MCALLKLWRVLARSAASVLLVPRLKFGFHGILFIFYHRNCFCTDENRPSRGGKRYDIGSCFKVSPWIGYAHDLYQRVWTWHWGHNWDSISGVIIEELYDIRQVISQSNTMRGRPRPMPLRSRSCGLPRAQHLHLTVQLLAPPTRLAHPEMAIPLQSACCPELSEQLVLPLLTMDKKISHYHTSKTHHCKHQFQTLQPVPLPLPIHSFPLELEIAKWRGEAVEHSETKATFAPHSPASRCRWHRLLLQKQAGHRLDRKHTPARAGGWRKQVAYMTGPRHRPTLRVTSNGLNSAYRKDKYGYLS